MKGVNIVAKTAVGAAAIRQALADGKKAPWAKRKAYEQMYSESIISDDPLTVRLEHRTTRLESVLPPSFLVPTLRQSMAQNGASDDDYEVMIDE
jgi:hypothetical protein